MGKFIKEKHPLVPKNSIIYKNSKGKTSIRFLDYEKSTIGMESEEKEIYEENILILEYVDNLKSGLIEHKILYREEIGMKLDDKELMNLERQLESIGHIIVTEILYYDLEGNIRIKEEDAIEELNPNTEELYPVEYMEKKASNSNLP